MIIPEILKDCNFNRVRFKDKKAFEFEWQKKPYTYEQILKYFPKENYGVICGEDLRVLDDDSPDKILIKLFERVFGKTFRVRNHLYFKFDNKQSKKIILFDEAEHLGEVQGEGTYVVGPGSTHPSGEIYELKDLVPIKTIAYEQFLEVFGQYIKSSSIDTKKEVLSLEDEDIIKQVVPKWREGDRQNLVLMLAGFLRKEKRFGFNHALSILKEICRLTEDKDFEERARAVQETYKKDEKDVKGYTGLVERGIDATKIEKTIQPSKQIFERTKAILMKYLDTTELNYDFLTIWTLGTYFHAQFETYPLLLLLARKQSGKTRTLKLISSLSYGADGSVSTSITETHLFRHQGGAIFFDEMESVSNDNKMALRELLNAVYKRGNKIVRYTEKRVDGTKSYVEECFFPFYPVGLANIAGFGDVLEDRALQLILQRSSKNQTKLIEDFSTNKEIKELKEDLKRMVTEIPQNLFSNWNTFISDGTIVDESLRELFEKVLKTNLSGRPLEKMFPLLVVSKVFDVLNLALTSVELIELVDLEGSWDDMLHQFITTKNYGNDYTNLYDIYIQFRNTMDNPPESMNPTWLGRALKRLGFLKQKRTVNGRSQVILNTTTSSVGVVGVVGLKGCEGDMLSNVTPTSGTTLGSTPTSSTTTILPTTPTNPTTTLDDFDKIKEEYIKEGKL